MNGFETFTLILVTSGINKLIKVNIIELKIEKSIMDRLFGGK